MVGIGVNSPLGTSSNRDGHRNHRKLAATNRLQKNKKEIALIPCRKLWKVNLIVCMYAYRYSAGCQVCM